MSKPVVVHSKLSFSSRKRWRNCPASVQMSVGLSDVSGTAALEGTIAHTVAEFYVRQKFNLEGAAGGEAPLQAPPVELDLKGKSVEDWNAELRKHGKAYAEFIQSLIPEGYQGFVTIEKKVAIPSIADQLFGTADCIVWVPAHHLLIVVDYKYGFEDVACGDAEDTNPQLAAYLVAAAETFELDPVRMMVAVFQPRRVIGMAGQALELPANWLQRERLLLAQEVARTQLPGEPIAGEHCRYCRAKAACPRTHGAVAGALNNYVGLRSLHDMTDDEVVQLWAAHTAFKSFWEDVGQRIENLAKTGHPAIQITTKPGRRMWRDENEVALTLLAYGMHDLLEPKALSEVYDRLPAGLRDTLIKRSADQKTVKLVSPGTPSEVAKLFKQYSNIIDQSVKLD